MQCKKCNHDIPDDANTCPHCGGNVNGKKKMPKWLIPVIIVLVVLCAIVGGNKENTDVPTDNSADDSMANSAASEPTDSTVSETKAPVVIGKDAPTIDYEFVDIMTLLDEYQTNEVAADQKYKDKFVKVSGKVKDIGKDILNNIYVCVNDGTDLTWEYAQCYFSGQSEVDKVANLAVGDTITLYGKVGNFNLTLTIDRCVIVE